MTKRWNFLTVSEDAVQKLQQSLGISPVLCRLLVQRGIHTYAEAKHFFRPKLQDLHDPFLMKNMGRAVRRLERAVEQGEHILLYGDYDVDGTTSVAMFYTFLKKYHPHVDYYIPDRYTEGYGLSEKGIEYAHETQATLMIVMDCGVKAHRAVAKAKQYDIDIIVCDHHLPEATLPDCFAMLNPKQTDCAYPYKELTGCGIAFKLAQGYQTRIAIDWDELADMLDLLVVSIGCDIVPITGENRILAYFGLQKLNTRPRRGLKTLMQVAQQQPPMSIRDVVFGLGPRINAAGRLADARQAVSLLLASDEETALKFSHILTKHNNLRRQLEAQVVEEAANQWTNQTDRENRKSVLVQSPDWHRGVLGIVAARMVETYYRPSIVCARSGDNVLVGSARSVRGFDIHKALEACSDLLLDCGGHQYAAGLTLHLDRWEAFCKRFEAVVAEKLTASQMQPQLDIAGELPLKRITPTFWKILQQFAPFGPGNRNPLFVTTGVHSTPKTRVVKEKHLKVAVFQEGSSVMEGIGFGLGHWFDDIEHKRFDICYNLNKNTWRNETKLQLNLKDIKPSREK